MTRSKRTPADQLLDEARAIEAFADESEVTGDRIQRYWSLSTQLVTLVGEIEDLHDARPDIAADDPALLSLRSRLRAVASGLTELAWP